MFTTPCVINTNAFNIIEILDYLKDLGYIKFGNEINKKYLFVNNQVFILLKTRLIR